MNKINYNPGDILLIDNKFFQIDSIHIGTAEQEDSVTMFMYGKTLPTIDYKTYPDFFIIPIVFLDKLIESLTAIHYSYSNKGAE